MMTYSPTESYAGQGASPHLVCVRWRVASQEVETLGNGIDEAVGDLSAAAFFGNVVPDIVEFRFCFRSNTMRH
jgi:hypothetical protein